MEKFYFVRGLRFSWMSEDPAAALAIAVTEGDGRCAFAGISLGRAEAGTAGKSADNSAVMTVAASLVLTALYAGTLDLPP